jgi:hypothetical protein
VQRLPDWRRSIRTLAHHVDRHLRGEFPLLQTIHQRRFAHAVAFHGFSEAGVLVGGGAPLAFKEKIARALARALAGSPIQVRIAGCQVRQWELGIVRK